VTPARMVPQEFVQRLLAAIKCFAVMFPADRFLVPNRKFHSFFLARARAAANNFAFGLGGFSKIASTRRLSLSDK